MSPIIRPRMLRALPTCLLVVLSLVLLPMGEAVAQFEAPSPIDEVDSSLSDDEEVTEEEEDRRPSRRNKRRGRGREEPEEPAQDEAAQPDRDTSRRGAKAGKAGQGPKAEAPRPPPPTIIAPRVKDADLLAAWQKWSRAFTALDSAAAGKAQQELLALKEQVGASSLDAFSMGLLRAAETRRRAQDETGAMQLIEASIHLAPELPYARAALAEALARKAPGEVGRYAAEMQGAVESLVRDPRYLRPALADVGTVVLVALLATCIVVVGVLFLRRVRYLLHDFHHLFPRGSARWQSATLGGLLLSMPIVFRLGLVPVLLVLLASVSFYLSVRERLLGAVMIALVGLVPMSAGELARRTAFAATAAEDVVLLESGGLGCEEAAARIRSREREGGASFAELFALGRYEARRGLLAEASEHFKAAASLRTRHAALLTNLGNVHFASGNEPGAIQLYVDATQADPSLPAPYYNLFQAYRRRAMVASDDTLQKENQAASEALANAQRLDRSLLNRELPKGDKLLMNQLLLSPPLPLSELPEPKDGPALAARVEAQLMRRLSAGGTGALGMAVAVGGSLLAFLLGLTGRRLSVARECDKCGRSVCRRCDKDLGVGSKLCAQCVNAFARKGAVTPQVRVRKQVEITRYRVWMGRISFTLGALVSGAGHLFTGLPVRGALCAFLFLVAVCGALLYRGVLRAPYGELPAYLKLVPLALLLIPLHLLTLRGLYRRQSD